MTKLNEHQQKLADLMDRQKKLAVELDVSLALQAFEPLACEGTGKARVSGSCSAFRPWDGKIHVHCANGSSKEYDALQVPFKLWPQIMQTLLADISDSNRPKLARGFEHV
jgi:hypothetical protein